VAWGILLPDEVELNRSGGTQKGLRMAGQIDFAAKEVLRQDSQRSIVAEGRLVDAGPLLVFAL